LSESLENLRQKFRLDSFAVVADLESSAALD